MNTSWTKVALRMAGIAVFCMTSMGEVAHVIKASIHDEGGKIRDRAPTSEAVSEEGFLKDHCHVERCLAEWDGRFCRVQNLDLGISGSNECAALNKLCALVEAPGIQVTDQRFECFKR